MRTNCHPQMLDQSPSHSRAEGAPFPGRKLEPRVPSTEGLFWSPLSSLGGQVPWTKGGADFLGSHRWPLLHCLGASLRNSGPPEPGTTFTGSELIMSFYELWGPRGTRINVKRACQPRSLGECHTLTKLKAVATPGRSCGLHVRWSG